MTKAHIHNHYMRKRKKELGILHLHKSKGALVRSRLKQIEEGEKIVNIF